MYCIFAESALFENSKAKAETDTLVYLQPLQAKSFSSRGLGVKALSL